VPQPKPSAWKSIGVDEIKSEILRLYPDEKLDGLIETLWGRGSNARKEKLREELRGRLWVLWIGLRQRQRPTGGSKQAALEDIAGPLLQAYGKLSGADTDTRLELEAQAAEDESFSNLQALEMIAALLRRIEKARAAIEPSPPGRRGGHEQKFVDAMRDLMRDAKPMHGATLTAADPSRAELKAFVDEICAPLKADGILRESPMTGYVKQSLYTRK
jgi:hypothetical protein